MKMMKLHFSKLHAAWILPAAAMLAACQDEVSPIGGSLSPGEVSIAIDTLKLDLEASSLYFDRFDSRAATNLVGRISTPQYGELECSYVARLLPSASLGLPDSIPLQQIDSMKMVVSVPRGSFAGDSVAPQQLKVFRLTRQLPSDIDNAFDPAGYYDPSSPLCSKNYTLSELAATDANYISSSMINLRMPLSREFLESVVNEYRNHPETFAWPSSFAQWFPGIYVEHSFGRGAVANVTRTSTTLYYHYAVTETVVNDDGEVSQQIAQKVDSVTNFMTSPAVLSANRVRYNPAPSLSLLAQSAPVVTSPGGYIASINIPVEQILEKYRKDANALSVISDLIFSIPAEKIESDVELSLPPYLLMVRKDKMEEFFDNNSVPDGQTSFWATLDSSTNTYKFSSMRSYIMGMTSLEQIPDSERDFLLIPVLIGQEDVKDAYENVTGYRVVSCTPYMAAPTMARLLPDQASFIFTFSQQVLQ